MCNKSNAWRLSILFLLIGSSVPSLTACRTCSPVTVTETVTVTPPEALLVPCEPPSVSQVETNADLVRLTVAAIAAYEKCAGKIEALRVFFDLDK